ncbi:dynein regulatory complex protein 1 homolog isoform X2 [Penaeus japonicus]|uniref:dynein regulatory complex protein 1 homolog isoform X2 n=1 Tax=Penaeus japonicus TaxID=27405 RepID=UPI001C714572|nr:dynein regulatory complex protein 1 homolog isoform X2 [Penaeus japonicus]
MTVLVAFCSSRKDGSTGKEAERTEALEPQYAGEKEETGRWNSFLEAFCRRTRAWTAIRQALNQYLHVLEGRLDETRRVERLRRENAELRHLLQGVSLDP